MAFKYEIVDDFDKVVDEKGNVFIALRKIKWGNSTEAKLDLRKYYSKADGETMSKGVSFLTEEGPHELVEVMVEEGYGDTNKLTRLLAKRVGVELPEDTDVNDEYFSFDDILNNIEGDE